MTTPKIAGVMGWPVDHSLSPVLHGFWMKQYGIDGSYVRLPVEPANLHAALKDLPHRGFAGCNLTVPHKEAAMSLVHKISDEAKRIGAANTIFVQPNGHLHATNSDAYGFMENLKAGAPGIDLRRGPALVLGAGGAARAVCVALLDAGVPEIRIVNRTFERAQELARAAGKPAKAQKWEDRNALNEVALLVNTTTLGMKNQPPLEIDLATLPATAVVNDIVYAPLETALLKTARARGNVCVDGIGMLLYQGQVGFEGWFGVRPDVTPALREHVLKGV
jgi:shikimate dehydrogenase